MDKGEFLRQYPLRSHEFAWFLGAGTSASAGIPTAGQMTWEFKRAIYCSQRGVPIHAVSNLADPAIKQRIQGYFDSVGGYPKEGQPDEYATYFEKAYPLQSSRQSYLELKLQPAKPSYGHRALAALASIGRMRLVWTTNFDRLLEDALIEFLGSSGAFRVATLADPSIAQQAITSGKWPIVGKLHGDFQSLRLKNISEELREQDRELRGSLVDSSRQFGMIVTGYSGRDSSVIDALREGIAGGRGYPAGFFWVHQVGSSVAPEVQALLSEMKAAGVLAEFVSGGTFDEFLADLIGQCDFLSSELLTKVGKSREGRRSPSPIPPPNADAWPAIRLNAVQVEIPTQARLIECRIGGQREVNLVVTANPYPIIARRKREGVVAFGSDHVLRTAFAEYGPVTLDLYALEGFRLYHESIEVGLLNEAMALGLSQRDEVEATKRHREWHLCIPKVAEQSQIVVGLRNATGGLSGKIPSTTLVWREAVQLNLQYRLGRCWLLLRPTVIVDWQGLPPTDIGKEFVRSRLAGRYNKVRETVLEGWLDVVFGGKAQKQREIRALGISDGLDAVFQLYRKSAVSRIDTAR